MNHKTREVKLYWQLIALALIMIVIAVAWFAVARPATGQGGEYAVPAPTVTAAPTPENHNHCMMLTDGICYIVFPLGCTVGEPIVYGGESAGVPVTCNTAKGK